MTPLSPATLGLDHPATAGQRHIQIAGGRSDPGGSGRTSSSSAAGTTTAERALDHRRDGAQDEISFWGSRPIVGLTPPSTALDYATPSAWRQLNTRTISASRVQVGPDLICSPALGRYQ